MKPADPRYLGATLTEGGANFALWAAAADAVEVCLFTEVNGKVMETRFALSHRDGPIFHGYLAGVRAGQKYGFRVYGPWRPEEGWRFNSHKLLIDPYAHLLEGELTYSAEIYGHQAVDHSGKGDLTKRSDSDSAGLVPYSVVTGYGHSHPHRLNTPWSKTVIYEAHVRGLTEFNSDIPEEERGTYKALGHHSTIDYLKKLGITALELLPIHHFVTEPAIADRGRENFWGYNALAFSAPHRKYAATQDPIAELREAVSALHKAGIEVILDVVYNHTAEGGHGGPTLSFRGIDSKTFYRRIKGDLYDDVTGCGNTVDARRPFVVRMIIDSLHWWSEVIGVDGFRFDLASALARNDYGIDTTGPLFSAIASDPILRERKLIAEPWDVAGYALGDFPHPWREWNDHYRDSLRQFWLADPARGFSEGVGDLASRLSGSHDIFYFRGPTSSINFITSHDGFTLADLVSYENKHNEPNQEFNRDGSASNRSWNLGVEGPSKDPQVNELRIRLQKSMLASLLLSSGVPMLTMGDEVGRSQNGSNNAYSLPANGDVLSPAAFNGGWALNWAPNEMQSDLLEATRNLISMRRNYLSDVVREFFTGQMDLGTSRKDLAWFRRNGEEMTDANWHQGDRSYLSMYVEASANHALLIILNASTHENDFTLPIEKWGALYRSIFDSSEAIATFEPRIAKPAETTVLAPHSVQIWLVNRT
ncbi:MAG: glycogen debranching protein GlgX [Actinomycetes bacterium]